MNDRRFHCTMMAGVLVFGLSMGSVAYADGTKFGLRGAMDSRVAVASGAATPSPATGIDLAVGNETIVVNQEIRSLLQDFATRLGVQVRISPSVRGTVQNRRLPGDPEAFLNALARDYAIGWFFDGPVLYVNAAADYATRLIGLGRFKYPTLIEQLKAAGLTTERFALRELPDANALIVTGPPEYIARIEVIMEALKTNGGSATDGVRIIRHGRVARSDGE